MPVHTPVSCSYALAYLPVDSDATPVPDCWLPHARHHPIQTDMPMGPLETEDTLRKRPGLQHPLPPTGGHDDFDNDDNDDDDDDDDGLTTQGRSSRLPPSPPVNP